MHPGSIRLGRDGAEGHAIAKSAEKLGSTRAVARSCVCSEKPGNTIVRLGIVFPANIAPERPGQARSCQAAALVNGCFSEAGLPIRC